MPGIFGTILKRSTKQFFNEGRRNRKTTLMDLLHGYVYLRWPYLYIDVARGDHPLSKYLGFLGTWIRRHAEHIASDSCSGDIPHRFSWGDTYHGKVVPLDAASQLIRVDQDIALECPEKVLPYPVARDIILKNPDHIVVLDCPCRASRKNPCKPLDVCLIIGDPFAQFVEEHHPQRSRRITREEAERILKDEDERGHVHHAFFKDAMLGRFYAICNCCSCCCGAMQAHRNGSTMLASSGYEARIDQVLCQTCGDCSTVCQFGALRTEDIHTSIDENACMGCGICVSHCAYGAISLVRAPAKGDPLEVEALRSQAKHAAEHLSELVPP